VEAAHPLFLFLLTMSAAADSKDGVKAEDGEVRYINLKVIAQDQTEVHFKIKRSTTMRKLIEAYCKRQGLTSTSVRFLFDGEAVGADDTPDTHEMEEGDAIDVMHQQTGGF